MQTVWTQIRPNIRVDELSDNENFTRFLIGSFSLAGVDVVASSVSIEVLKIKHQIMNDFDGKI